MPDQAISLIRIHPKDNVLVLIRTVHVGDTIEFDGHPIRIAKELALGHKLAAQPIAKGQKVLKYGLPIGTATEDIGLDGHVHVHNLQSDYLPIFTHDSAQSLSE